MADTFVAPKFVTDDGEVAFQRPVAGVTPTSSAHLTTKAYVDAIEVGVVTLQSETLSVLFDDMLWASLPNNGWTSGSSGTGTNPTSVATGVDSTERAQGVVKLTTGSTSTGRGSIYQCLDSILLGQGASFEFEARLYLSNLSTDSDEYVVHFGLMDGADGGSEPVDSVAFAYRGSSDGDFWTLQTRSNDSETKTITATEPSTSAFSVFKIVVAADGSSAEFFIDKVSKGVHTTNIPTGAGRQTGIGLRIAKTVGTSERTILVDWVRIRISGAVR